MIIKKIRIKNVRGIDELEVDFKGGLFPNKPSILVAPNGSGKSSFATAFKWLNCKRMKLNEKDAYQDDNTKLPELEISTDEPASYSADNNKNTISGKFGVYVINMGLKTNRPGLYGNAKIVVDPIVLLDKIKAKPKLKDDFEDIIDVSRFPDKTFTKIIQIFTNPKFINDFNLKCAGVTQKQYDSLIQEVDQISVDGLSSADVKNAIASHLIGRSSQIKGLKYLIDLLSKFYSGTNQDKIVLDAFRMLCFAFNHSPELKVYMQIQEIYNQAAIIADKLKCLPKTWKNIKPHKEGDKLIVNIGDAQKISNGERDFTAFICHLIAAEATLTRDANILIIDEVFDYLDDANLMVAQHEITKLIKTLSDKGKCIYPIILTHINPTYYKSYAFSDLKVYYLRDMARPNASDNIFKLARTRIAKKDEYKNNNKEDEISKYLFHFHPSYKQLSEDVPVPDWKNPLKFKSYCNTQLNIYLGEEHAEEFDPLGVCVALREKIERYCYDLLNNQDDKDEFIKENGTKKKINILLQKNIDVPELFSILGNLYNDPLHAVDRNQISIAQTLYSRMNNNHIRDMVRELCEITDSTNPHP